MEEGLNSLGITCENYFYMMPESFSMTSQEQTEFSCILESPGNFFSKFKVLKY